MKFVANSVMKPTVCPGPYALGFCYFQVPCMKSANELDCNLNSRKFVPAKLAKSKMRAKEGQELSI